MAMYTSVPNIAFVVFNPTLFQNTYVLLLKLNVLWCSFCWDNKSLSKSGSLSKSKRDIVGTRKSTGSVAEVTVFMKSRELTIPRLSIPIPISISTPKMMNPNVAINRPYWAYHDLLRPRAVCPGLVYPSPSGLTQAKWHRHKKPKSTRGDARCQHCLVPQNGPNPRVPALRRDSTPMARCACDFGPSSYKWP